MARTELLFPERGPHRAFLQAQCPANRHACHVQAVQDVAAEGLPHLSRHRDLEKFLHVDDDTQWILDEPTPAMLREMVVGAQFTAATQDTLAALEGALEEVEVFRASLQPFLDMLQEMRGISGYALQQQFRAGDIGLEGLRALLQTLASYQSQISELQVRMTACVGLAHICAQTPANG